MTRYFLLTILVVIAIFPAIARDPQSTIAIDQQDSLMAELQNLHKIYESMPSERMGTLNLMTNLYDRYIKTGIDADYLEFDVSKSTTAKISHMAREMLANGKKDEALKLFLNAALRGDAQCMNMSGILLYEEGLFDDAFYWWNSAIKTPQSYCLPAFYNITALTILLAIVSIENESTTESNNQSTRSAKNAEIKDKIHKIKRFYDQYMKMYAVHYPTNAAQIKSGYSATEYLQIGDFYTPRRLYLYGYEDIVSGRQLKSIMRYYAKLIVDSPNLADDVKDDAKAILNAYPKTEIMLWTRNLYDIPTFH